MLGRSQNNATPSRLPKRLVDFAPSICRRKSHIAQLDVIERGEKCALPHSRVPFSKQRCASSQRCRGQRTSAIRFCLHPGSSFPVEMTQRFVAMLACGSCHVLGCHEPCFYALPVPIRADRLIAGCIITAAAPLRLLLSISKYLQIGSTRIGVRFILASKLDCIFAARFAVVTCERFGLCRTIAVAELAVLAIGFSDALAQSRCMVCKPAGGGARQIDFGALGAS